MTGPRKIAFDRIASTALVHSDILARRWLPDGRREGAEWSARNPRRSDRRPGSMKLNLRSGRWSDFATGDAGGDLISLAAYVHGISQREAAERIAEMLGLDPYE
jgi:hypothetical protein